MVRAANSTALDYHKLPRRKLQQLCKKHGIPANKTNLFMADALTELFGAVAEKSSPAEEKVPEASPRSQIDESSQCTTENDNNDEAGKSTTPVSSRPRKSVGEQHSEGRNSICTNVVMGETKEEQDDARSKARSLEPEREGNVGKRRIEESSFCVVSGLEVVHTSYGEAGRELLDIVEVKKVKVEASVTTSIIQEHGGPQLEAKQAEVLEVPEEKVEPTAKAVLECPQEAVDGDRVQEPIAGVERTAEAVLECPQEALDGDRVQEPIAPTAEAVLQCPGEAVDGGMLELAKLPREAVEHVKMEADAHNDEPPLPVQAEEHLKVKRAELQDSARPLDINGVSEADRGSELVGETMEVVQHEKATDALAGGCSPDANLDNTVPELVRQPVEAADVRETLEDVDVKMEEADASNLELVTQAVEEASSCDVPDDSDTKMEPAAQVPNMVKITEEKDVQMEEATKVSGPAEVDGEPRTQGDNANRNEKQDAASFDMQLDLNADQAILSELSNDCPAAASEAVPCAERHEVPPHEDPEMKVEQLEDDVQQGLMSIDADEGRQETTLISSEGAQASESLCNVDQAHETAELAFAARHSQAWKEMLERVVRTTRHRSSYKPAPFFKRTMLNRSLQKARSKRFEILTKQRMIQTEDASTPSAPRPVFGRKRFIAKAMEEFSKRKQQEKLGSSQVANSEQQQPEDRTQGSLTPASATKQAVAFPGGRLAMEQQRKRQEQFKTPIKGKSKDKAQDLAKKLGSAQRDSKLRALRGIEDPVC